MKSSSSRVIELTLTFDEKEIDLLENIVDRAIRQRIANGYNDNALEKAITLAIDEARHG